MAIDRASDVESFAQSYARRGWRVLPIPAGEKHPHLNRWQDNATCDPDLIHSWWQRWPTHGVGILTGQASGLWVLDVDVREDKRGDETLSDLEAENGALPATPETQTGGGGRHIFFALPSGLLIANDAGRRLGPGLDVRGEGGQVVAPPSIHESGRRYVWELEHDPDDIALLLAPPWLVALLTMPFQVTAAPTIRRALERSVSGFEKPGEDFEAKTSWAELLSGDGAVYIGARVDRHSGSQYQLWSRPGLKSPHTSATLGYAGSDVLKVHSSEWAGLAEGATYTRFGYFAATRHGGDFAAAATALRLAGFGGADHRIIDVAGHNAPRRLIGGSGVGPDQPAPGSSSSSSDEPTGDVEDESEPDAADWLPGDMAAARKAGGPPAPGVMFRADGIGILYQSRVSVFMGEPESLKSWAWQVAAVQVLAAGGDVLVLDFENDIYSVAARLTALGATDEQIDEHVSYISPSSGYTEAARDVLVATLTGRAYALIVVDGITDAMATLGLDGSSNVDAAKFDRVLVKMLARAGGAVVLVDHVTKDVETRGKYAIGAQHKMAAITGAAFSFDIIKPFGHETEGLVTISIAKDKPGFLRSHAVGKVIGLLRLTSWPDGRISTSFDAPDAEAAGGFEPTAVMAKVWTFLESHPGMSKNAVYEGIGGRRSIVMYAIELLVSKGQLTAVSGSRGSIMLYIERLE